MRRLFTVLLALGLIVPGLSLVAGASAPAVAYGTATVDGSAGEWDLSTSGPDYFAGMFTGGDPNKELLSNAFIRYDCATKTMYVLVMKSTGRLLQASLSEAWVTLNGVPKKLEASAFSWVGHDAGAATADGYEASYLVAAGSYTQIEVHANVYKSATETDTSALSGHTKHQVATTMTISCASGSNPTPSPTPTPTPTPMNEDPVLFGNVELGDLTDTSWERTHSWTADKALESAGIVKSLNGGTTTSSYEIVVDRTQADSGWRLDADLELYNPNNDELSDVALSAETDLGGVCTIYDSDNATVTSVDLPANDPDDLGDGTTVLTYVCLWSTAPSSNEGNATVDATWDAVANNTPSDEAHVSTPFSFDATPTNEYNASVAMTDTATVLDPPTLTDDHMYNYTVDWVIPTWNCQTYDNTAAVTSLDEGGAELDSSSASVKVCGPAKTGALSMGFWQNKNGQAIITGSSATAGVCNVGTHLRGYAPFQDMSGTSCTQVARYVFDVVKAASSKGASMNAMLKSQMLALSLDVYFSDPGLGGNQIAAPAPIGNWVIDLALIPPHGDVSSAFGADRSIGGLLSYAASQSNVGGTNWYGNVKLTQAYAKDTFDGIIRHVVFGELP